MTELETGFDYGPDGPKRIVVCRFPGCMNEGIPLVLPADGSPVDCGPCGFEILEITPLEDAP